MSADLAPSTIAAIEALLAKRDMADIPGLIRKQLSIVITRADVIEVYRRIAVDKLGRATIRGSNQQALARPADFETHAAREFNPELCARYGVSVGIISRWRAETGAKGPERPLGGKPAAPVPDGFAVVAPGMTMKELRLRYSRSPDIIRRWLAETGVSHRRLKPGRNIGYIKPLVEQTQRDMTQIGQAADYLRRYGPVFRCNARGGADAKGTHWRRGIAVLTDAELIERAESRGWNPDAWRQVA